MKKILTSLFVFAFAFLFISVSSVSAKVLSNKNGDVTVAKGEIINDDLFIGAQTVEIAGTVNGDVFIGAQTVKVTGVINGNLHVGAQALDLGGSVKGNVYAAAQSVLINSSKIGGSLLVGGAAVSMDKDTVIGGSVMAGAGSLSIDSQVKRSVYAGTGSLNVGNNAKIGKDLYYAENQNGKANISGKVAGSVYKSEMNPPQSTASAEAIKKQLPAALGAIKFGSTVVSFLGTLIVGLIFIKLFGKHFAGAVSIAAGSFWKSFGIGFLVIIAIVPALLIMLITIIGIPLAGLTLLMFALLSYFSKLVIAGALGAWLYQKLKLKASTYWAFALGLLVIYILKLIPIVGGLSGLVVLWSGLGALTLHAASESKQ